MDMTEVEVWLVVDENGDAAAGMDADAAGERYAEDVGAGDNTAKRLVCIKVKLPTPRPATATVTLPDEDEVAVAAA